MKNFSKLFLVFALIAVSAVCKSQVFTAADFISLAYKSSEGLVNDLNAKGYTYTSTNDIGMSKNEIYTGKDNMTVTVIVPDFEDGQSLFLWEFTGLDNVYRNLQQELVSNGFKRSEQEVRNGSRYVSTTYYKPGLTITLSSDKTSNSKGVYRLSTRYSNPGMYQTVK